MPEYQTFGDYSDSDSAIQIENDYDSVLVDDEIGLFEKTCTIISVLSGIFLLLMVPFYIIYAKGVS